jgi:hypothetical protein
MKYRPSALEEFISKLPNKLQVEALQAIHEEKERYRREDFTDKEKWFFNKAKGLGSNARKLMEDIAQKALNREYSTNGE